MDTIFLGDFNVELNKSQSLRSQRMVDLLIELFLIDMVRNFQQHRRFWDLSTWTQVRQGAFLRSRCDYILGMDRRHFKLFGIWDMCNYTSNHFAIREKLLRRPTRCHARYLRGRRAFQLKLPPTVERSVVNMQFKIIKTLEPPPSPP